IARGPIPVGEALNIAKQIAEALEAAHEKGVIHRDLKPANIKVTSGGKVKVLDFGLAKTLEIEDSGENRVTQLSDPKDRATLGMPAYMSPEQMRAKILDRRTDVWSFGCVLYELVSGRSAFSKETTSDTVVSVLEHEPDWRALPASLPIKVQDLLRRCL